MLISTQSTNPAEYNTVKINLDIPWKCNYVKYYVSAINTKANILMTTDDDYLLFETINEEIRIRFNNIYSYSLNSLVNHLNSCQSIIKFTAYNRTISLHSSKAVSFKEGSHRAKVITGLYNTKEFVIPQDEDIIVPDLPILDLANKLYLVSLQGVPITSNINEQSYTPSVIANIDSIVMDGEPLIVNYDTTKPIKIKCNTDSLKYLEMRLVDFQFQPVILKSPLFITLKIKPSNDADVKSIISK